MDLIAKVSVHQVHHLYELLHGSLLEVNDIAEGSAGQRSCSPLHVAAAICHQRLLTWLGAHWRTSLQAACALVT